jgi:hypothetical protein
MNTEQRALLAECLEELNATSHGPVLEDSLRDRIIRALSQPATYQSATDSDGIGRKGTTPTPPAAAQEDGRDSLATKAHLAMCDAGDSVKYYYYADPSDENCKAQELCMAVGFSDNDGAKIYFHLTSKCGCAAMLTSPDSGKEGDRG